MNLAISVLLVLSVILGLVLHGVRVMRRRQLVPAVDGMLDAKGHEMRQRFVGESETMRFIFIVLAEPEANRAFKEAWSAMIERTEPGSIERVWALQLRLSVTAPLTTLEGGTRNLVWAVVQVGRESVEVEVRYLLVSSAARAIQIKETAKDLVYLLKKRGVRATLTGVYIQPDPSEFSQIPVS